MRQCAAAGVPDCGKGMAARSGGLASRGQGEADQGVVVVGVGLWRRAHGWQSSPEWEKGCGGEGMPAIGLSWAIL